MPKGTQGFVKGDPNINRSGNRQPIVWSICELFTHWGLRPEDPFPWDKPIPKNYRHVPQSIIYLIYLKWSNGQLIDKIIPDVKSVDVTTDGESLKNNRPLSELSHDQLKQIEAIVDVKD